MSLPPLATATFWIAVILGMTAAFIVFAHKWRGRRSHSGGPRASDLLAEFLEVRSRGDLSEQEYQRIKERLNAQIQRELAEEGEANSGDAAQALKQTARILLADYSARTDERETTGAASGAAREDCDAAPPSGGDSTEERR